MMSAFKWDLNPRFPTDIWKTKRIKYSENIQMTHYKSSQEIFYMKTQHRNLIYFYSLLKGIIKQTPQSCLEAPLFSSPGGDCLSLFPL